MAAGGVDVAAERLDVDPPAPTNCAPSTTAMHPRDRASADSSATGMRKPVELSTWENDSTRVRVLMPFANRLMIP